MQKRRVLTIFVCGGLMSAPALGWVKPAAPPRAPKPVKVKPSPAPRAQAKPNPEAQQNAGDQALQKLSQMSPADRQKALANLPAGKRAQVLKQLQSYQTLSPQAKARANGQLQQLQSLPPKQQNQVRGSLQKFQKLPEERRTAVGGELDRLGAMPADQRAARMSSPEFKSAYSSQERQMMGDISKVLPPGK